MTREHIQHAIDIIYNQIFNQGRADLLPGLVSGPYIQHNPLFPNGLDGIIAYIKQAGSIPCEVKRVAIDGDLAVIHVRYLNWAGKETAGVDIFRFDGEGKIVEHWDVLQPVPASSNNRNTMFCEESCRAKCSAISGTLTRLGSQIVPSHNGFPNRRRADSTPAWQGRRSLPLGLIVNADSMLVRNPASLGIENQRTKCVKMFRSNCIDFSPTTTKYYAYSTIKAPDKGEVGGSSPPRPTIKFTSKYAAILTFLLSGNVSQKSNLPTICQL